MDRFKHVIPYYLDIHITQIRQCTNSQSVTDKLPGYFIYFTNLNPALLSSQGG